MTSTIFALATAPGRAAIAVVRISGPAAREAAAALGASRLSPRVAHLRRLAHPVTRTPIDQALALWFPAPGSFTGEDQVELHLHGGSAVVEAVSEALSSLGLVLAGPGAFTRRAFENGKLDLSQAEAIADLVDAETAAQAGQALAQLDGALAQRYSSWREILVEALAWLEAAIDFPDEDLPDLLNLRAGPPLRRLREALSAGAQDVRGEAIRDGYRIALIGAPNAGKSSLLNALAKRDAAIVTAHPGTTRDIIEVPTVVAGFKVLLADTAGLRDAADPIEAEGVRRALGWAESATLRLWVVDQAESRGSWREAAAAVREADGLVLSKVDQPAGSDAESARAAAQARGLGVLRVSTRTDHGLDELRGWLERRVASDLSGHDFPATTRLRHRALLAESLEHLDRAIHQLATGEPELVAEDVRLSARALERLAGRIDPEAVLDRVFATFCIGK